ncbi:MAG: hypothetical protein WCH29_03400 [Chitinophagaceae bacterium]
MNIGLVHYHIPYFIYAPSLVKPAIEKRMVSQIDLAPTVLGMMNLNYTSRFMGFDIYKTAETSDRVFISTYQDMGYIRSGKLVILSPKQRLVMFQPDFISGMAKSIPLEDSLVNEAIVWYQGASY